MLRHFLIVCLFAFKYLAAYPSVIIIGAGASGIAAATKLLENGFTNITILEAENRIGGRIYSVPIKDGYVDLGAEFCHGEKDNVVYQAVKDLDLLGHPKPFDLIRVYYSNSSKIDHKFALNLLNNSLDYESIVEPSDEGVSIGDKYLEWYNDTFISEYKNDTNRLKIAIEAIKLSEQLIIGNEGSFNWYQSSAGSHDEDCEGDQRLFWKQGGYHTILNILMKKIPKNNSKSLEIEDKLLLNKTVTKIRSYSKNLTVVTTSDEEIYLAKHIILTASLGVLQSKSIVIPRLPKKKFDAIDALGFNAVMKIILHFPEPWWKNDFLFLWSEEDLNKSGKDFPFGYSRNEVSWITSLFALIKCANPNVLIGWITGDMIPEIEKLSDDEIRKGVMFAVRKFLHQDYNITEPDLVLRSNWHSNPNFRGSYSYETTKFYRKNLSYNAILAEPFTIAGHLIVQFAGEATSPDHYATVHGAIESGWREAQRIINLYKH